MAENRSPRDAIRRWLRKTERQHTNTVEHSRARSELKDSDHSHHHSHERNTLRHHRPRSRQRKHCSNELSRDKKPAQENSHLAPDLDLQGPFRTFVRNNDMPRAHHDVTHRHRKRKRRRSPRSTSLEPAATVDLTKTGIEVPEVPSNLLKNLWTNGASEAKSISAPLSTGFDRPSSEDQVEVDQRYKKRSRHKTRQDRYEVKNAKKSTEESAIKDGSSRKVRKRTRKDKSGAALIHEYRAPNLLHDRLTLKQASSLGLFGRGKASSPKKRPMPDLAFSELDFLNSRKEKKKTANNKSAAYEQKTNRANENDAEMSRYFSSRKEAERLPAQSRNECYIPQKPRHADHRDTSPAFVELPDRPFLGFGSCGRSSTSPTRMVKQLDARYVPSRSQRDTRSSTRATSYFTWSQSSPRSWRQENPPGAARSSMKTAGSSESIPALQVFDNTVSLKNNPQDDAESLPGIKKSNLDPREQTSNNGEVSEHQIRNAESDVHQSGNLIEDGADEKSQTSQPPQANALADDARQRRSPECHRGGAQRYTMHSEDDSVKHDEQTARVSPHAPLASQYPRRSYLDVDLDNLLHQCKTIYSTDPVKNGQILVPLDLGAESAPTKHDLGRSLKLLHSSRRDQAETDRLTKGPSDPDNDFQRQRHALNETTANRSLSSHGLDDKKMVGGRVQGAFEVIQPAFAPPRQASHASPARLRTDSRNAWNGYGHLFRLQLHDKTFMGTHSPPNALEHSPRDISCDHLTADTPQQDERSHLLKEPASKAGNEAPHKPAEREIESDTWCEHIVADGAPGSSLEIAEDVDNFPVDDAAMIYSDIQTDLDPAWTDRNGEGRLENFDNDGALEMLESIVPPTSGTSTFDTEARPFGQSSLRLGSWRSSMETSEAPPNFWAPNKLY